jgi:hypothetical protein
MYIDLGLFTKAEYLALFKARFDLRGWSYILFLPPPLVDVDCRGVRACTGSCLIPPLQTATNPSASLHRGAAANGIDAYAKAHELG